MSAATTSAETVVARSAPPDRSERPTLGHRLGYRPALDGIRGLLFLVILIFHSEIFVKVPLLPAVAFVGGFMAVDGFFVLSGFLITTLLLDEWEQDGRIRLGYFYMRRALRLLPAIYAVLLACSVYVFFWANTGEAAVLKNGMLAACFYYANWAAAFGTDIGALLHTWSLSLEEQFYFLWPPLLALLLRLRCKRGWIIALCVIGIVTAAVWRGILFSQQASFGRLMYASDTRADALLAGCLLSLLWAWYVWSPRVLAFIKYAAIGATLFLIVRFVRTDAVDPYLYLQGGFTWVALGFALLIWGLLEHRLRPVRFVLEHPFIVWCGRASYGLYLWHVPVIYLFKVNAPRWGLTPSARVIGSWMVIFSVAALSFYCLEQPFLRLKKKFSLLSSAARNQQRDGQQLDSLKTEVGHQLS